MPPQLIQQPNPYKLDRHVIDHEIIISHLGSVLKSFANKGFSQYYIGITNDLQQRLAQHQRERPEFRLMVPIYEEATGHAETNFERLEREAITKSKALFSDPRTLKKMTCANTQAGTRVKAMLYVLVG